MDDHFEHEHDELVQDGGEGRFEVVLEYLEIEAAPLENLGLIEGSVPSVDLESEVELIDFVDGVR